MPRPCSSCDSPFARELDRQLRADVPLTVLSAWTRAQGSAISRNALARHRRDHIGRVTAPGRKPVSDDLLAAIRDDAAARLADGEIRATVKDGIAAQRGIDAREAREKDRDWQLRLALVLSGRASPGVVIELDPAAAAIEREFRPLLETGTEDR